MANEHFFAEVRFQGSLAVLLLASEGQWKLRSADKSFNFEKLGGKGGTFKNEYAGLYRFFADGDPVSRFALTDLGFPPSVILEPKWLQNKFNVGEGWAKALGFKNPQQAAFNTAGHWYAIASGPLMTWIKQYCEERTAELKKLAISLGINIAAIFDPTGGLSLVGAIDASVNGDYLGCVLNLLAAVPLLGKAAQAARNAKIVQRMEALIRELKVLEEWMRKSKAAIQRTSGMVAQGLDGKIKIVKAATVGKVALLPKPVKLLINNNWIKRIDPSDYRKLGILPKEVEVLQSLAKQGFYFVVRSCNPARVEWLQWAAEAGCRVLGKPLWIKAKSLKTGGCKGLVGYKLADNMDPSLLANVMTKATAPKGFNPQFLSRYGGKMQGVYKMEPRAMKKAFGVTDQTQGASQFLVRTDDGYLILTDAKGAPYVSDFDVVLIQKEMSLGSYGPPGFRVGPEGMPFKGGDNADLRPFWNKIFARVNYPPGYEVFQHGEATGTAGNFAKAGDAFEPAWDVRKTIWSPEDTWDTEQLIVAAKAEGLPIGVGYTNGWTPLKNFHDANPMGEFRITR